MPASSDAAAASRSDDHIAYRRRANIYRRRRMWLVTATVLSAAGGSVSAQETASGETSGTGPVVIPSSTNPPTTLIPAAPSSSELPALPTAAPTSTTRMPTTTPSSSPTAAPTTPEPTATPTFTPQPTTTPYPSPPPTSRPTQSRAPSSSPTGAPTLEPTASPTPVRSLEEFPYVKMSILGLDFLPNKDAFDYWSETTSQWIVDWWGRDAKEIIGPDGNILPVIWPVDIVSVETYDVDQNVKKGDEVTEGMVMDIVNAARGVGEGFPGGRNSFVADGNSTTSHNTTVGGARHRHLSANNVSQTRRRWLNRQRPRRLQTADPTDPTLRLNTLLYSQNIYYYISTNATAGPQVGAINPMSFATYPFLMRSDRDEYLNRLKADDPTGDVGTFQNLRASTPAETSKVPFTEAPTLAPTPPPAPSQGLSGGAIAGIIIGVILAVGVFGAWYVFRPLPGEGGELPEEDEAKDVGWRGVAWTGDGETYGSLRNMGGGGSGGAPLYYDQPQSSSKLAKKLRKSSGGNGKPSDGSSRNSVGEESTSLSQMSLRPFSTVKKQESGGSGGEEYRATQDASAIAVNKRMEEGDDASSYPEMNDTSFHSENNSDSTGLFGPHMLRVQDIEDMQ